MQAEFLFNAKYSDLLYGETGDGTVDFKPFLHKVALSIPVGVSYEYKRFVADLRYNVSLTHMRNGLWGDIDKSEAGFTKHYVPATADGAMKNSTFSLTIGYKIGL